MRPLQLKTKARTSVGEEERAGLGSVSSVLNEYIGLTRLGAMRRIRAQPFDKFRAGFVNNVPPGSPPVDTLHVKPNVPRV